MGIWNWFSSQSQDEIEKAQRHALGEFLVQRFEEAKQTKDQQSTDKKDFWKPYTPLYVKESSYGEWRQWFAWYPVELMSGKWVFFRYVYYRKVLLPFWFTASVNCDYINEYSTDEKGYYEL